MSPLPTINDYTKMSKLTYVFFRYEFYKLIRILTGRN